MNNVYNSLYIDILKYILDSLDIYDSIFFARYLRMKHVDLVKSRVSSHVYSVMNRSGVK